MELVLFLKFQRDGSAVSEMPADNNPAEQKHPLTGALRKRGELDNLSDLVAFADKLEKATIDTIEEGVMTGDLYILSNLPEKKKVGTEEFIVEVNERLKKMM